MDRLSRSARATFWLVLLSTLAACASAGPRFPSAVTAAFRRDEMRHAKTENVELYYPAEQRELAMRILGRLDRCVEKLRKLPIDQREREPVLTYLTSANFNNAYAYQSVAGNPRQLLLPTHLSLDLFNWFNLGIADVGEVSCHEAVHYVHMEQIAGTWDWVNRLLGDVYSPNAALESWFSEGLATYYEARLEHQVGRPTSPVWRTMFESGIAKQGGFRAGDLNNLNRRLIPFGANYLAGSHFIEWLVKRYGEHRLWTLIDQQGRSVVAPLWVSLRFLSVYGHTLDGLVDQYAEELEETLTLRERPAGQRVLLGDMGYLARIAPLPGGAIAAITTHFDDVDKLTVREADGRIRFSRGVAPLLPGRDFTSANPIVATGLSAGPSTRGTGTSLYLVVNDVSIEGDDTSNLLEFDAATGDFVRSWGGFIGVGGSVAPDGKSYVLVDIVQGTSNLASLDLTSGVRTPLTSFPTGESLTTPVIAPDGKRIAFVRWARDSFDLALLLEDGTIQPLTFDAAFDHFPRWVDDQRLVFMRMRDGRGQAHVLDLASGQVTPVTEAPYLVFDPIPSGEGKVAFLNRDGWEWTLDEVALPPAAEPVAPAQEAAVRQPTNPASGGSGDEPRHATVLSDEPYRSFDHFLEPTLRGVIALPWIQQTRGARRLGWRADAMLKGSDRLGLHDYALNLSYLSGQPGVSFNATYGNHLAAPWYLQAGVSRAVDTGLTPSPDDATLFVAEQDLINTGVELRASRTFWTVPVGISLHGFDVDSRRYRADGGFDRSQSRFVGPGVGASWGSGDGSPLAGTRVGLSFSGEAAAYHRALFSAATMADLRLTAGAFLPLPLLKLQTFRVGLRGRSLPGSPAGLLKIGGGGLDVPLFERGVYRGDEGPRSHFLLPGPIAFRESLRGYEDALFEANHAVLGDVRWRYPFIVDRGWVSTFYLFPSIFLRQIDLELFGAGAFTDRRQLLASVGGQLSLRTAFAGVLPVSLVYQLSLRNRAGYHPLHQVGLRFE